MSILTMSIGPIGPLVEIGLMVSKPRAEALTANGVRVPDMVIAHGLIDTGATCTCIDPSIVQKLGLSPTGTTQVYTPSSGTLGHNCDLYDVALGIVMGASQAHVVSITMPVLEAELAHQGFEALIGRDVLARGSLFYNGQAGSFTLSF
jgi:predicted aspartyl protease